MNLLEEKSLKLLEFDKVLTQLSNFAISDLGKIRCRNTSLHSSFNDITYNQTLTTEAKRVLDSGLTLPLEDVRDVSEHLKKAQSQRTLEIEEIIDVYRNLKNIRYIKNFLDKTEHQNLKEFKEKLFPNKALEERVTEVIDETDKIREGATPELRRLHQALRSSERAVKQTVSKLLNNSSFCTMLQDTIYTIRDDRVVFQVKAEHKNKIQGIVHDVSASMQTYFIEPKELVALNNKIREIRTLILSEIEKILKELSREIAATQNEIGISINTLVEIDFIFAKAKYSISLNATEPTIETKKIIDLKSMKNPVLMGVTDKVVENDFKMEQEKNSLIITGSNTGGKTVVLKTVGLLILMCKSGLHVPCFSATIYPFGKIYADIGDEQSIIQSLSTFSAHMKSIIEIVNNSNENSLVLLDEICVGTDPKEGFSLAKSILEYLQKSGCFSICTTHYGELKSLAFLKEGFKNASVEFNKETLSPTYKILMDIPGVSNAIIISKNLGLKQEIVDNANQTYFNEQDETAKIMQEVQSMQQTLSASTESAVLLEQTLKEQEADYKAKIEEIKKHKKKNIEIYKKKYETKIHQAKETIKEIFEELQKEKTEAVVRRSFNRLNEVESKLREGFQEDEQKLSDTYQEVNWSTVKINDKLLIKDLDQEITLLSLPNKTNNVHILLGQLKTTVKTDRLALLNKKTKQEKQKGYSLKKTDFQINRYNLSQTIDLRGERVEEALNKLELYLDKASLAGFACITIIHGHGTGALKQAIKEYLSTSPYVLKFEPAPNAQGGDGVSIVELK